MKPSPFAYQGSPASPFSQGGTPTHPMPISGQASYPIAMPGGAPSSLNQVNSPLSMSMGGGSGDSYSNNSYSQDQGIQNLHRMSIQSTSSLGHQASYSIQAGSWTEQPQMNPAYGPNRNSMHQLATTSPAPGQVKMDELAFQNQN
ncbi:hypothetical protein HDU91_007080 [Kappamyces sp. JEL0680]|nr:hypothetical protein HDU91_007080 [Kappamyces sp. JEL0680]